VISEGVNLGRRWCPPSQALAGERPYQPLGSLAPWHAIGHSENATDVNRIILFCDVERPMKFSFMTAINRWVSQHLVKASATQNVDG
jgi:hypothetical protein